jgi:hypothetical protein
MRQPAQIADRTLIAASFIERLQDCPFGFPLRPGLNGIVDSLFFAMAPQAGVEPAALVLTARCFYRVVGELGGDGGGCGFPPRRPTTAVQQSLDPDCIVARRLATRRGIVREGARPICPIWARPLSPRQESPGSKCTTVIVQSPSLALLHQVRKDVTRHQALLRRCGIGKTMVLHRCGGLGSFD